MYYRYFNPNPCGRAVGDCAVRAISAALGLDWDQAKDLLAEFSKNMCDMDSSDQVWGAILRANGFYKRTLPDYCPMCYTAEDFCRDNPYGIYVLSFSKHVATVIDGVLYDSWDSSNEIPVYFWYRPD
jgi:hypothetical protein